MFPQWRGSPQYSKLESGNGESLMPPTKIWPVAALTSLLCVLSFGAGWMLGAANTRPSALPDVIPSLPVTGRSRQQVMTLPEMQAAPPANGSHEPAWDKLIPNGLGYVKHPTLAPEFSVIGIFHQLHCLYTVRRAYYAVYAASIGQEFNKAGVREPDHIGHCLDYLQQSLVCNADVGIEPFYAGHYPDVMFGRQCRDFSEIQTWATRWRAVNAMIPRIDQLAAIISANTNTITNYLDQSGLPHPSFDADGPITLNLSPQAERARSTAIDALQELLDLLQGPIACMLPKYNGTSLQVISRHDIARKVPMEGTISFTELAEATDLHANDLKRIMRFAMSFHRLFAEPQEGFIAHSAGSKKLATDEIVRAGLGQSFDEFYGSFARTADALDSFKDGEPNHTGFALAHNTDKSMFDFLRTQPSKADQFSKAMRFYSAGVPGYSESHLVEGYDWDSLGAGTVVDVGGADGHVSRALSKAYPRLNIVVQDLPDVVAAAEQAPPTNRIRYQAHNFFSTQPVAGADVYLFRWVFHDWPDHYVIRILRSQVPALRKGARILVNESLSPPSGSLPLTLERTICFIDLLMLTTNNSRLRTMAEWQDIFSAADSRFGTIRRCSVGGAALAILEVVWEGE